jgi:hypothetical protein
MKTEMGPKEMLVKTETMPDGRGFQNTGRKQTRTEKAKELELPRERGDSEKL